MHSNCNTEPNPPNKSIWQPKFSKNKLFFMGPLTTLVSSNIGHFPFTNKVKRIGTNLQTYRE